MRSLFSLPFSTVTVRKAEDSEKNKWLIYIEASNEFRDKEREIVLQKAMADAQEGFLREGTISWNHKHKDETLRDDGPKYVVGEPLDVRFSGDERNSTLVKGILYHKNKLAQDIMDNLESGSTRFGASIGGKKLSKSFSGSVDKIIWDEVALTYSPVNATTLGRVSLGPMEEFAKSLMAGSGINPEGFSGGRTMIPESLQGVNVSDDIKEKFVDSIGWAMQDAVYDVTREKYKKVFKDAIAYIADNLEYTDDTLREHLSAKGVSQTVIDVIIEYLKTNMNKALHVLRI